MKNWHVDFLKCSAHSMKVVNVPLEFSLDALQAKEILSLN